MPKTTTKQLAANRTNAARSTGPRTALGKARSAQNARKHTFAGTDFAIVKIEERDAVDRLRSDLIATYAPVNSQELFAVERIALCQHNLLRIARFEAGLFTSALNRALMFPEDEQPFVPLHEDLGVDKEECKVQNRYYCLAHGFHAMNRENAATWALFLRYQTQVERQYRRAVEEFGRLKVLRSELEELPELETTEPAAAELETTEPATTERKPPELAVTESEKGKTPNEPIFPAQLEGNADSYTPKNEPISTSEKARESPT